MSPASLSYPGDALEVATPTKEEPMVQDLRQRLSRASKCPTPAQAGLP